MAQERTIDLSTDVVVEAAIKLLELDSVETLTLTRVAEELGVTQPALYRHVEGIDDLWRLLGLQGRERLADALTDAALGVAGRDAVVAMANAWRSFVHTNRGLYAATDMYPCAGDEELEAAVERVVHVLAISLRGFGLDTISTVDAARMLRSALHGFVHLEMGDGHPHPHDNDSSFERMIRVLCAGFARLDPQEVPT